MEKNRVISSPAFGKQFCGETFITHSTFFYVCVNRLIDLGIHFRVLHQQHRKEGMCPYMPCIRHMCLYYKSGFRTETIYDYYIVMKSMFLVVKLSSQPTIGYVNLTILLP